MFYSWKNLLIVSMMVSLTGFQESVAFQGVRAEKVRDLEAKYDAYRSDRSEGVDYPDYRLVRSVFKQIWKKLPKKFEQLPVKNMLNILEFVGRKFMPADIIMLPDERTSNLGVDQLERCGNDRVAVLLDKQTLHLYGPQKINDVTKFGLVAQINAQKQESIQSVRSTAMGDAIAVVVWNEESNKHLVRMFDIDSSAPRVMDEAYCQLDHISSSAVFGNDYDYLVLGAHCGHMEIFDMGNLRSVHHIKAKGLLEFDPTTLSPLSNGRFASFYQDGAIKIWNGREGTCLQETIVDGATRILGVLSDKNTLVLSKESAKEKAIELLDTASLTRLKTVKMSDRPMAFAPLSGAQYVISLSNDTFELYDVNSTKLVQQLSLVPISEGCFFGPAVGAVLALKNGYIVTTNYWVKRLVLYKKKFDIPPIESTAEKVVSVAIDKSMDDREWLRETLGKCLPETYATEDNSRSDIDSEEEAQYQREQRIKHQRMRVGRAQQAYRDQIDYWVQIYKSGSDLIPKNPQGARRAALIKLGWV